MQYWTALGLLRGVMSSPRAGTEMLRSRLENARQEDTQVGDGEDSEDSSVHDNPLAFESDRTPTQWLERTPWSDAGNGKGRNHYAKAFSCLLAGAGVRGGTAYGETDEFGANIVRDPVHVHDYHATLLHLMGLDHLRLTYRYGGRDFRLTDVAGNVLQGVLA